MRLTIIANVLSVRVHFQFHHALNQFNGHRQNHQLKNMRMQKTLWTKLNKSKKKTTQSIQYDITTEDTELRQSISQASVA